MQIRFLRDVIFGRWFFFSSWKNQEWNGIFKTQIYGFFYHHERQIGSDCVDSRLFWADHRRHSSSENREKKMMRKVQNNIINKKSLLLSIFSALFEFFFFCCLWTPDLFWTFTMTMGTKWVWAMRVLIRRKKGIIWSNGPNHSVDSRIYMASEIRDGTLTHQNGVKGKKTFSNSNEAFLGRPMRDSRTKRLWNYTTLSTANTHIFTNCRRLPLAVVILILFYFSFFETTLSFAQWPT